MKLARWTTAEGTRGAGFIRGSRAYVLPDGLDVADLLERGLVATLELAAEVVTDDAAGLSLDALTLLPPLQPASIRDFVAFEEHVEGVVRSINGTGEIVPEWYEAPTFYFTNPHTVNATGQTVAIPAGSSQLDFELEVAVVIGSVPGSDGRNLDAAAASDHIFGYTILNDWSARDLQRREMKIGLGPSKGKDFANTLGPWIITADEFTDLHDEEGFLPLAMTAEVNGDILGSDILSNMGWPFAELVSYASRDSRVAPGDVLGSGTCGSGCLAELWGRNGTQVPHALRSGDEVRLTVDGIGTIVNTIGQMTEAPPVRPARKRPGTGRWASAHE